MEFVMSCRLLLSPLVLLLLIAGGASAAEPLSSEVLAQRLISNTVTVRALLKPARHKASSPKGSKDKNAAKTAKGPSSQQQSNATPDINICSGVSLGRDRIVTFCPVAPQGRYHVTLADGQQAVATPVVIDYYSGLTLLKATGVKLEGLVMATKISQPGSKIITAAAAGLERPSLSVGILSASGRVVGRAGLPPLLECDLRTTETSSGAGVLNTEGKLLGVVAATDSPGERKGWTYAVPASHVVRLMRANIAGQVVVLRRRRPVVGWTLAAGNGKNIVIVQHVVIGGAAHRAGVKKGDQLAETLGRKIHNPYQAVNGILNLQPGDRVTCVLVEKSGKRRVVQLTLGGGQTISGVAPQNNVKAIFSRGGQYRFDAGNNLQRGVLSQNLNRPPLSQESIIRRQQAQIETLLRAQQKAASQIRELSKKVEKLDKPAK
jgi:S1-C subfamily serine protease